MKQNLETAKNEKSYASNTNEPVVTKSRTKTEKSRELNAAVSIEEEEKARKRQERERRRQKEEEERLKRSEQPQEVQEILGIQQETLASLARSKGINEETLKIADGIAQKLAQQTEQMEAVQVKLDELGSGLKRAGKEANTLLRGIATDKLMMVILCCIILIALAIIVARIVIYYVGQYPNIFPTSIYGSPGNGTKS